MIILDHREAGGRTNLSPLSMETDSNRKNIMRNLDTCCCQNLSANPSVAALCASVSSILVSELADFRLWQMWPRTRLCWSERALKERYLRTLLHFCCSLLWQGHKPWKFPVRCKCFNLSMMRSCGYYHKQHPDDRF